MGAHPVAERGAHRCATRPAYRVGRVRVRPDIYSGFCDKIHLGNHRSHTDLRNDHTRPPMRGVSVMISPHRAETNPKPEVPRVAELPNPLEIRKADHEIEKIFLKRWSPRAMNGSAVSQRDLNRLFEAARWAPSTYNEQEWRYLYAHRDTPHWQSFFDLLLPANQAWCANAGVLTVVIAHKVFALNGQPNPVYHFDAGASAENLMLQGAQMGLVVHAMAGFDARKACQMLQVPSDWEALAMIAIGHPGDPDQLPAPLRERETPTSRKPVAEIAWEGGFRN